MGRPKGSKNKANYMDLVANTSRRMRESFARSEYFQLISDAKVIYQVDRKLRLKQRVSQKVPAMFAPARHDMGFHQALLQYRPDQPPVFSDDVCVYLNTYEPPKFLMDDYWDGGRIEADKTYDKYTDWQQIPDCYLEFFSFILDNHLPSIEYFMDWLATAIDPMNGRNLTALVLISTPGVGKGVLFTSVLSPLFGAANAALISGENAFVNQFNGQFADKQLVMLDEANITTPEAINRFKTLVNASLEVEKKGQEKYNTRNWLNIIIASNQLDSIYIEEGDRRFSVVHMNKGKMLGDAFDVKALVAQLEDEENIAKLFSYLIQHKVQRDMNKPFRSSRLSEIKHAGLKDWERSLLELTSTEKPGAVLWLKELQDKLLTACNLKTPPGASRIKQLSGRFPDVFQLLLDAKSRKRYIKIKRPYDTTEFEEVGEEPPTLLQQAPEVVSIINKLKG